MYNEDIDGVTIDPLGQDVRAGQSRTPPIRRSNKRVGNVWSARFVLMGVPKAERDRQGIDTDRRPPGGLVAVAMEFAVMKPTDRDSELVADFSNERSRLSKSECGALRRASGRGLLGRIKKPTTVPSPQAKLCYRPRDQTLRH